MLTLICFQREAMRKKWEAEREEQMAEMRAQLEANQKELLENGVGPSSIFGCADCL